MVHERAAATNIVHPLLLFLSQFASRTDRNSELICRHCAAMHQTQVCEMCPQLFLLFWSAGRQLRLDLILLKTHLL